MFNTVSVDSVNYSMQKLSDFVQVNKHRTLDEKIDGLNLYCEAVGLNTDTLKAVFSVLMERFGANYTYHMFVGVLLGLGMAEHGVESGKN